MPFINELTAIQLTGLWTIPADPRVAVGEDFDVMAWPAARRLDRVSPSRADRRVLVDGQLHGASTSRLAKAFVQWLWVDQTDNQLEFATSLRLPHAGLATASPQEADVLESEGPAANDGAA